MKHLGLTPRKFFFESSLVFDCKNYIEKSTDTKQLLNNNNHKEQKKKVKVRKRFIDKDEEHEELEGGEN